jgi:L-fuconolactonase
MIVDSHVHVWALARGDYGWLTAALGDLYRDVDIAEAVTTAQHRGVSRLILVQAAPTVAETEYLLAIAAKTPEVLGVVGWVDFVSADSAALRQLAADPLLLGLRPMLQDDPAAADIIGPHADPLFAAMVEHGLVFDALVRSEQIDLVAGLAARHPKLKIVLDHGGKPPLAAPDLTAWKGAITQLADHANVAVKLSGLLTEAAPGESASSAAAILTLLDAFGANRCLWGSDWPVLSLAADYANWLKLARSVVVEHAPTAHDAIFGGTARRLYDRRRFS